MILTIWNAWNLPLKIVTVASQYKRSLPKRIDQCARMDANWVTFVKEKLRFAASFFGRTIPTKEPSLGPPPLSTAWHSKRSFWGEQHGQTLQGSESLLAGGGEHRPWVVGRANNIICLGVQWIPPWLASSVDHQEWQPIKYNLSSKLIQWFIDKLFKILPWCFVIHWNQLAMIKVSCTLSFRSSFRRAEIRILALYFSNFLWGCNTCTPMLLFLVFLLFALLLWINFLGKWGHIGIVASPWNNHFFQQILRNLVSRGF